MELTHQKANVDYALDLGVVIKDGGVLRPANPIYQEMIGRYLSYGKQQTVALKVPETPWVKDDGLDMAGLMASISNQDYPVVEAIVVILAFWVVLSGTAADLVNRCIDPRMGGTAR